MNIRGIAVLFLVVPFLVGPKCFDYDERLGASGGQKANGEGEDESDASNAPSLPSVPSGGASEDPAGGASPSGGGPALGTATADAGGGALPPSAPREDSGAKTPTAFVPAVPCARPKEARIRVVDFAYKPQCGCKEPDSSAMACTVAAGTTVVWQFAGSEDHNVAGEFGNSGPAQAAGEHKQTFNEIGVYPYRCSVHKTKMSGYSIVVE